jgi:hypothetical protein
LYKIVAVSVLTALVISGFALHPWDALESYRSSGQTDGWSGSDARLSPESPQESYNIQETGNHDTPRLTPPGDSGKGSNTGASTVTNDALQGTDTAWNPDSPKLHGLAVGESRSNVEQRYGQPNDTYTMQDDNETLQVSEYGGYTAGYGDSGRITFVEVFDSSVETGLNGLRIGDSAEQAIQTLGKPDERSDFVLIYTSSTEMLKLDLDPEQQEVLSAKLFLYADQQ